MLTDADCKNASCPPEKKQGRFYDAGGLYLQVSPNASKRWFLKYRTGDKEKQLALGSYPAVSLKAARQATKGRVIAVHQPHRYSRLSNLFEDFCTCFNEADVVAIADVYSAGEDPIPGASRDDLVAGLIAHGHRHARAIMDEADLARLVREQARPGDMVVCLGAGTISAWANGLPDRLTDKAA